MTDALTMRHNGDSHVLHQRMRDYFADKSAKEIERATKANARTVRGWKSEGRLPVHAKHWWALKLAYRDLTDVLFNPDQEAVAQRLDAEHHALCEELGPGSEEPAGPSPGETAAVTPGRGDR